MTNFENSRLWTREETNFLEDSYPIMSTEELAKILNRSTTAIYNRCQFLGILKYGKWTPEMDKFLIENYGKLKVSKIALHFNINPRRVSTRIRTLKLKQLSKPQELKTAA